jgi:glucokinase
MNPLTAALAIDIGGTKLAAAIVAEDGSVVSSAQKPTPGRETPEAMFGVILDLVAEVSSHADGVDIAVCGVGCGGPMESTTATDQTVSPLNIPAWRDGFPLRSRLREVTRLPVFVDNDAKALALGEGWIGAATGVDNFIAMVVSTGVGGGIILDGRLLDGDSGNAGHIGHVIVEPEGRDCACGSRGCLEAEASGTSIEAITGRPAAQATPDVIERTGTLVGRGVASVANLLDLGLAVVAGSVALGFGSPFFAAAQAELDRKCRLSFSVGTRIVPARLGAAGPLVGAAAVGFRGLRGGSW